MNDNRLPVPQGPGWTCFHCGDTFLTQGEAEDHFGFRDYEDNDDHNPACIERLLFSEKQLRAATMELFRELEHEREENQELEDQLQHLEGIRPELERLFGGASTVHQAGLKLEAEQNRALTAEAIIAELAKCFPNMVEEARATVCGDRPQAADPCKVICRECAADGICIKKNPYHQKAAA